MIDFTYNPIIKALNVIHYWHEFTFHIEHELMSQRFVGFLPPDGLCFFFFFKFTQQFSLFFF